MKFPIGFSFNDESKKKAVEPMTLRETVPAKCLAQVYFPKRNQPLTSFNNQFDLKRVDFVFVGSKLKGIRGIAR